MVGTQVASLYATMGADISKFQRGMGTVDNMLHSAGGKLGGFVGMLGTGLVTAAAAGAAGLAAAGAGIVGFTNKAATAQQSVADIAANMQLSAAETEKVAALVNDLGIDPKLKVTAGEAAAAIDMLGKNGLSLAEIFDGASRATILLANSTKADFGTAADIATDVMQQFNISAKDMMSAVNGITGTTQNSKFDINDYRLALAQAGGVASSVGVSFDDFNATIAAISPLFAGGSDAGTSFKTFLQRLTPSTKPAIKAMKELGIITADGKNQFFDASGSMKSMAEIAGTLQWAFAGLSDEQKNQYASTIFGTDAMRAAFAMANAGSETINKLKTAIGNTNAEEAAATRMDTLRGDYEIFTGVVDALSIRIGGKFIPAARQMLQWATDMVSGNADKIVSFFDSLVGYIPKVSDALAWGNQKWAELTTLLQPAIDIVGRLAHHFNLLWIGIKEADVGIFASGIRGLMFEFDRGLKAILDYVASINWPETLRAWSNAFMTWGGAIWDNVSPYLRAYWTSFSGWVTDPARRQELIGALSSAWNWFSTWAGDVSGKLIQSLGGLWSSLKAYVMNPQMITDITKLVQDTWAFFTYWGEQLWNNVSPTLRKFWETLKAYVTSPQLLTDITKLVQDTWAFFTYWGEQLWNNVSPTLRKFWETLKSFVTSPQLLTDITKLVQDTWTFFSKWAEGVWLNMAPHLVGMYNSMISWINIQQPGLGDKLDGWRQQFVDFAVGAKNAFSENLPQLKDITETNATSIISDLGKMIIALDDLFNYARDKGPAAVSDWGKMFTAVYGVVSSASAGVVKSISAIVQGMTLLRRSQDAAASGNWAEFSNIQSDMNSIMSGFQGSAIEEIAKWIDPLYWLGYRPESIPQHAAGGRFTAGGPTIVGERGPELVDLPGGSYVHNAVDTADMRAGGSSRIDVYVHANGTMPTDRTAIRELAVALQREFNLTGARVVMP